MKMNAGAWVLAVSSLAFACGDGGSGTEGNSGGQSSLAGSGASAGGSQPPGSGGAPAAGGSSTGTGGAASVGGAGSSGFPSGGFASSAGGGVATGGQFGVGGDADPTGFGGSAMGGNATPQGGSFPAAGGSAPAGGSTVGGAAGLADGGSDTGAGGAAGNGGASAGGSGGGSDGGAAGDGAAGTSNGGSGSGAGGSPSLDDVTIVPDASWACGMPDGVPPPAQGELVFSAELQLGDSHDVGETPYGSRRFFDVASGTFTGDGLQGEFLVGGLDLELTLPNDAMEVEQINILRTGDGSLIYLRSCGFAPNAGPARMVLDFEAPNSSSYAWLNQGVFAGTRVVDETRGVIELTVYDISGLTPGEPSIQLEDPADVPDQPWECNTQTGSRGASVFTETVTLGSSLSTGASKRGTRNIIPITGGTVTGRLTGSVVPGGADYQLIGSSAVLDARYSLHADDGEYVLVRNCGPMGALVPWFEARTAGPYAFLNENTFVSSDPGGAAGGVSITFYERQ